MTSTTVGITPIGGVGEFGMNCLAVQAGGKSLVIDSGMLFPDPADLGTECLVPDFSAFRERFGDPVAVHLTHSHEDHVGSLPFFLRRFPVPVYATPYTIKTLARRLSEAGLPSGLLQEAPAGSETRTGPFRVRSFRVTHSTVDCVALAVETPAGTIVHTGDFKFDDSPVCGAPSDLAGLRSLSRRGVAMLLSDSTGSLKTGRQGSESDVVAPLADLMSGASRRVVVSCFASSVHRIKAVCQAAAAAGRSVAPVGRSLQIAIAAAGETGFLPPSILKLLVTEKEAARDESVVLLVTGCQGEADAALSKLLAGRLKGLSVGAGDLVILSSRVIPGNERLVGGIFDECLRRGAQVADGSTHRVHVSGHGAAEDMRMMIDLLQPRYVVPVHGERRQLEAHKRIALETLGCAEDRVPVIENGMTLRLQRTSRGLRLQVEPGRPVPKLHVGADRRTEITDAAVSERRALATNGVVILSLRPEGGRLRLSDVGAVGVSMQQPRLREAVADVLAQTAVPSSSPAFGQALVDALSAKLRRILGAAPLVRIQGMGEPVQASGCEPISLSQLGRGRPRHPIGSRFPRLGSHFRSGQ